MSDVLSFKCPCCTAALNFSGGTGQLTCEYCGASFTIEQAKAAQEAEKTDSATSDMTWTSTAPSMIQDEEGKVTGYLCSSCGAEMVADGNTAATECPYCGNNAIIPQSFEGMYKPDLVVPFSVDRKKAQEALRNFYRGKKLLPKSFTEESRIENITGLYVPFWLMSCHADGQATFEGIKRKTWEDPNFRYEKRDYYRVLRQGGMNFERIPADASTKMDDDTMDSLEPYDLTRAVPYDAAYFSGYLADRYDLTAQDVQPRGSERVENSFLRKMEEAAAPGYSSVSRKSQAVRISDTRTEYAMMPVWMLSTKFEGQVYSFAMNGQSGKVAGRLPVDKGKYWKYFLLTTLIVLALGMAALFFLGDGIKPGGAAVVAVVALIIGFLYAQSLKSAMNTVAPQRFAGSYLNEGSIRMGPGTDQFLYSKTDRTPKAQNNQNGQNGPSGGPAPRPGPRPGQGGPRR